MDLIVVGMRFQSAYKYGSVAKGDKLLVMIEPSNSVNKNALAVYTTRGVGIRADKIGYIRDADLVMAHRELFSKLSPNGYTPDSRVQFEVTKVQANYICISYIDTLLLGSPTLQNEEKIRKELEALKAAKEAAVASLNSSASAMVITGELSQATYANLSVHSSVTATASNQFTIKKEEPKMTFNTSNLKDSFFREVKNVAFDLQSGKLGVTSKDGISVYTADGVSVNPITEMGFAMPAFAMRVPVADLKEGDILIGTGDPVFFKEFNKDNAGKPTGGYKTVSLNGAVQEVGNVTNLFFGKNSVLAVKNMFGDSSGGMNPMMLMAMSGALGGGDSKIDPIMLMAMSGGMGGGDSMGGMNPMMLALMLSKK